MTGTARPVITRAEEEISFPTRKHLRENTHNFIILLDDLEHSSQDTVREVYEMYRQALDHVLNRDERRRGSMHFLVNMLEAYYLGDPGAVCAVLALDPALLACHSDVEGIRNPKADLKRLYPGFQGLITEAKSWLNSTSNESWPTPQPVRG